MRPIDAGLPCLRTFIGVVVSRVVSRYDHWGPRHFRAANPTGGKGAKTTRIAVNADQRQDSADEM